MNNKPKENKSPTVSPIDSKKEPSLNSNKENKNSWIEAIRQWLREAIA